mmetsp:Transcript_32899/g.94536  ORF Transcript_32899/g.94536 Transcript_32899/m.94536 type:complete len:207 (-) Transcript_32899:180-800(-)
MPRASIGTSLRTSFPSSARSARSSTWAASMTTARWTWAPAPSSSTPCARSHPPAWMKPSSRLWRGRLERTWRCPSSGRAAASPCLCMASTARAGGWPASPSGTSAARASAVPTTARLPRTSTRSFSTTCPSSSQIWERSSGASSPSRTSCTARRWRCTCSRRSTPTSSLRPGLAAPTPTWMSSGPSGAAPACSPRCRAPSTATWCG